MGKQFQREEGPSLRPESESVTEPGPESGTGFPGLVAFPLSQEESTRTVEALDQAELAKLNCDWSSLLNLPMNQLLYL